jgi:hypothetical protein
MSTSCWFGVKLPVKNYFFDFICSLKNLYALLTVSGAAALTGRRNMRGLSKADCRAGRETISHCCTMDVVELVKTN